jgi:transmembrane sensor
MSGAIPSKGQMAMSDDVTLRDAAIGWFVRTNDPDFDAWDDFTAWLESDPANADAYHAVASDEADFLPVIERAKTQPAQVRSAVPRRAAFASVAAAIAAALAIIITPRVMPVEYHTVPGEIRTVSLGGRDQLVMNGETSIKLTGFNRQNVRLEKGQVVLSLLEPGPSRVALTSGDLKLVDVGTTYEVSRDGHQTRVLVSDGAVLADPDGARLQIDRGQRLDTTDGAPTLRAMPADIASVGSFQRGQLSYVEEPLGNVVADLRRSTGLDIYLSEAMTARRFTGTLSVAEVRRDPRSLGPLLGVSLQPSGKGWKLQGRA